MLNMADILAIAFGQKCTGHLMSCQSCVYTCEVEIARGACDATQLKVWIVTFPTACLQLHTKLLSHHVER